MIAYSFFTLFAALTAVYLLFLFRLRRGLRYLASEEAPNVTEELLPDVTVLVPARNEEERITECIASLLAQDYPADRIEVIIIDDHSEDATSQAVRTHIRGNDQFRMLSLAGDASGKKAALTLGVRNATGSIIVTTDADCRHAAGWLRAVLSPFQEGADVVAGPVVYDKRGSLFARLQALEFLGLVGVGAGFFGIGYPRLCNGANFAYRKSMFDKVHGYDGNDSVHTGDDEFLLHRIVYREGGRAVFAATEAAIVHTDGAATLSEFFRQRVRWASKTRQYEDRSFVSFLVVLFVYLLFAAAAPVVSSTSAAALIAGAVFFALKVIADTAVLIPSARMFRQPIRMGDILVGEFLHAYYIVVVTCIGMFGKFQWKNRRLKNSTRTSG